VAVYPGTFDPITNGHVDLVNRALTVFDKVVILVAHSGKKQPLFDPKTRQELIRQCFPGNERIAVDEYEGLLVDYAKKNGIRTVLRGLRAVSDFEYEFQMSTINRRMFPQLQTFLLMASENYFFVNSTLVKEIFAHGGDISEMVPAHVNQKLKEKLC
jgi:pantetheine-phosphate adenylyltransferase